MRIKSEAAVSSSGVYTGDATGDAFAFARGVKPEKRGCIWEVVVGGRNVLGEGSVSTGGIGNPAVAGAQSAEVGGVGSWVDLAPGSKAGDWEGSSAEGSHAEMEGRREGGAREEDLEGTVCLEPSSGEREMGSLQRGQPVCSSCLTRSVRSWR